METAVVPVKSAWYSKINWTAAISALSSLAITLAAGLPAEQAAIVLTVINLATNGATWAFRTFGNASVSPASLG
jgi:hypothetical protein